LEFRINKYLNFYQVAGEKDPNHNLFIYKILYYSIKISIKIGSPSATMLEPNY